MFGLGAKIFVAYPLSLWLVHKMRQSGSRPEIDGNRLTLRRGLDLADYVYRGLLICGQYQGGLKLRKTPAFFRDDGGGFYKITRRGGRASPLARHDGRRIMQPFGF